MRTGSSFAYTEGFVPYDPQDIQPEFAPIVAQEIDRDPDESSASVSPMPSPTPKGPSAVEAPDLEDALPVDT